MSNLRNGSKGGFEPGLTRLRVRHSTTELPRSTMCAMPHSNMKVAIPWAEGELVWCCLDMAGPEGQSSNAGAAIKGYNRVEEDVCKFDFSLFLAGSCS